MTDGLVAHGQQAGGHLFGHHGMSLKHERLYQSLSPFLAPALFLSPSHALFLFLVPVERSALLLFWIFQQLPLVFWPVLKRPMG